MKKSVLLFASLMCAAVFMSTGTAVFAQETCGKSKYTLPVDFVTYGMDIKTVDAAIRKKYPKYNIEKQDGNLVLVFPQDNRPVFDMNAFIFFEGKLVAVKISYSNQFQDGLGGPSKALMSVLKKFVEKFGKADDISELDDKKGYLAVWEVNEGGEVRVIGKDPYTIIATFACKALEEEIRAEKAAKTNFGF